MESKRVILLLFFSGLWLLSTAQIKFIDGYIVNNKHQRIDCLIRNIGKAESTMNFEYKLKDNKNIEPIELSKIEEFGSGNELKCIRALIKIDVSTDRITRLKDTIIGMDWEEGHGYLKVLVEGKRASLYTYYNDGKILFFYSSGSSAIEPLIYKVYQLEITSGNVERALINNTYLEQLKKNLACGNPDEINKVSYTKKTLVQYFVNYNSCKEADYTVLKSAQIKKGIFKFKLAANGNRIGMSAEDLDNVKRVVFSTEISPGFGAEAEYILPMNNYKWSIFAESNYHSYFSDYSDNALNSSHDGYVVDYKTIEVPIGVSYYMNFNKDQRLYLRTAFVPQFIIGDSYIAFHADAHWPLASSSRMLFGVGYNYRRLGVELRYYTRQNVSINIYNGGSDLAQTSLRISYTLFQTGKLGN